MRKIQTILFVDDDELQRRCFQRVLGHDFIVVEARDGTAARHQLERYEVDLAIVDQTLDGAHGLDVLLSLRELEPDLVCLLVSANLQMTNVWRAGASSIQCHPKVEDWRTVVAQLEAGELLEFPDVVQPISAVVREAITRAMLHATGIQEAADKLEITRQGLRKKLDKLGLAAEPGG
jgi:DNA-binding NtrC family response regulator